MKKNISLLALLISVFLLLAACNMISSNKKDLLDTVVEKGVLRVGTAGGYFPFEMIDKNGDLIGFDIDMAKNLADELGVQLELHNYDFSGLIPALQASKIDIIISGMTITEKRAETVDFTMAYFNAGIAMLVNQNYPGVEKWQDLDKKGNVIAVSMGTTGDIISTKLFQNAEIKRFDGSTLAGLEVVSGKATAVLHDYPWVAIYSMKNPETTYGVLNTVNEESLGMAVAKNNPKMLEAVNGFLEKYLNSDEYQESYNYWFINMDWLKDEITN